MLLSNLFLSIFFFFSINLSENLSPLIRSHTLDCLHVQEKVGVEEKGATTIYFSVNMKRTNNSSPLPHRVCQLPSPGLLSSTQAGHRRGLLSCEKYVEYRRPKFPWFGELRCYPVKKNMIGRMIGWRKNLGQHHYRLFAMFGPEADGRHARTLPSCHVNTVQTKSRLHLMTFWSRESERADGLRVPYNSKRILTLCCINICGFLRAEGSAIILTCSPCPVPL